jgi:hypothetical protein
MCSLWVQDKLPGLSTILGRCFLSVFFRKNKEFPSSTPAENTDKKKKQYKTGSGPFPIRL